LRTMVLSLPSPLKLLGLLLALAWLVLLIRAFLRNRWSQWAMLFFLIPLFTLMALNWARLYPVSSRRLTLFPSAVRSRCYRGHLAGRMAKRY
jgi:hypothetical protein